MPDNVLPFPADGQGAPEEPTGEEHHQPQTEPLDGVFQDIAKVSLLPPTWVINEVLPVGLTFVHAPPKAMKSTITMVYAALIAGMKCDALPPVMAKVERDGPVVVFSYEASAGELRWMLERELKVRLTPGSIYIADDPWEFRLDDEDAQGRLLAWLEELDPRLVILDPLRDFHQLEERDSGGMNRMLRPLRQWAVGNEASLLVVHHSRKQFDGGGERRSYDETDMRGTSALFAIADGVLSITPKGEYTLEIKAKYKRGAGWTRVIDVAAYGNKDGQSRESLTHVESQILKLLVMGAHLDEAAKQVQIAKHKAVEACAKLERNGLIKKTGRSWAPTLAGKRAVGSVKPQE